MIFLMIADVIATVVIAGVVSRMRQDKLPDQTNMSDTDKHVKSNKNQSDNGDIDKVKLKACTVVLTDIYKFDGSLCAGKTNALGGSDTVSDLPTCSRSYGKARARKVVIVPTQDDTGTTRFTVKLSDTTQSSQSSDPREDGAKLNYAEMNLQAVNVVRQEDYDWKDIHIDTLALKSELNSVHEVDTSCDSVLQASVSSDSVLQAGVSCDSVLQASVSYDSVLQAGISCDSLLQAGVSCDSDKTKAKAQKVVILATQVNVDGQKKTKFMVKSCDVTDCDDLRECDDDMRDSSDTEDYSEPSYAQKDKPNITETDGVTDIVAAPCTEENHLISIETPSRTSDLNIVTDDSYNKRDRNMASGETPYRCVTCGKTYRCSGGLKQHKAVHDANVTHYTCSVCGRWYRLQHSLNRHKRKQKHTCDTGHVTVNRTELAYADVCAVTLADTGVKSYPCPVCGQLFSKLFCMKQHRQKCCAEKCDTLNTTLDATNQIKPYKCGKCMRAFVSSACLKVHAHRHDKRYQCSTCGKLFYTSSNYSKHIVVHKSERRFSCKLCGKTYKYQPGIRYHMLTHTGKRPQVCDKCGKSFMCATALKIHGLSHLSEKIFPCSLCEKSFVIERHLGQHNRTHTGIKSVKSHLCFTCGKAFKRLTSLRNHVIIHSDDKPYICETCGKAFKSSVRLKTHTRTHTGEKPYSCGVCGTSFAQASALDVHKRIHTNVKPYTCAICGKSFVTSSQIKTHEKSHSGVKPHACTICGRTFTLPHQRRAHEKTHNNATKK